MKRNNSRNTTTVTLIKLQMCHSKCSPDAYGFIRAKAPQVCVCVWTHAHITLKCFYVGELN